MFLISKIVRGRRLLHELEAETARRDSEDATGILNPTAKAGSQLPRRQQQRSAKTSTVSGISIPSTSVKMNYFFNF